jgi:hypothetical protein
MTIHRLVFEAILTYDLVNYDDDIKYDVSLTRIPGVAMNERTRTDAVCGFFPDCLVEEGKYCVPSDASLGYCFSYTGVVIGYGRNFLGVTEPAQTGDLGLHDSDLQAWGHSSCFLLNAAPHPFGGPVEGQKAQDTYAFSRCHLIYEVSISIFQWTIVVLTPGTGLDGLVKLVASSVIAGKQAWLLSLAHIAYKRKKLLSLMWFLFFFLSHLSYLLTIVPPTRSSSSRSLVSSGSSITSFSDNVSFYSCVSFSQGPRQWCSSS